ncbi:MAG: hypothetical protein RL196_1523 [Actinomycetota bacterium]|jgi:hypothetical protein
MPLKFSEDLDAWQKWQDSRHLGRQIKARILKRTTAASLFVSVFGENPELLIAVDATTPTAVAAFLQPLKHIDISRVAVIASEDISQKLSSLLPANELTHRALCNPIVLASSADIPKELAAIKVIFSGGHYLPAGKAAELWARELNAKYVVAQHGLLTPFAPPLPENSHALVFSASDGDFWASGRSDISHEVVGSQLLWDASQSQLQTNEKQAPIFLGQLHGAEIARTTSASTAVRFCLNNGALYRPHPAEIDRLSIAQHRIWRLRGVNFDSMMTSMGSNTRPVISIFSTGVLEAAAAGVQSWVTCEKPVDWLFEFWNRYQMGSWGGSPTKAPIQPEIMPAFAISRTLLRLLDSTR